jgi:hypothetical protein
MAAGERDEEPMHLGSSGGSVGAIVARITSSTGFLAIDLA